MRPCALRRVLALCTVLAFALGLAAHGVAAADMGARMMTAAMAGAMSPGTGGCDGCGSDDDGMPATGCFALCGPAVAVLPAAAPLDTAVIVPLTPIDLSLDPGRARPPDPHPPRLSVLN